MPLFRWAAAVHRYLVYLFLDELLTVEDPPLGNNQFLYSIDNICIIILKSESVWPQGFWKRDCVPEMQNKSLSY